MASKNNLLLLGLGLCATVAYSVLLLQQPFSWEGWIDNGIYGEATAHGIDIAKRKAAYLRPPLLFFLLVLFLVFRRYEAGYLANAGYSKSARIPMILLLGLGLLTFIGTGATYYPDLYEMGNPANTVNRLNGGELPFIHYLSSHLLSEQLTPVLYHFFVGDYGDLRFTAWMGWTRVLDLIIIYLMCRHWTNDTWGAFGFVILFPLIYILFPKQFTIGLLPLLSLIGLKGEQRFFVAMITSILLLFWKIDAGIAALMSSIVVALFIQKSEGLKIRVWLKPLLVMVGGLFALFAVLQLVTNTMIDNLIMTLDYFRADQASGRVVLTDWSKDIVFIMHHRILPFLVGLLIFIAYRAKVKVHYFHSLLYLSIFYFANFQRGLVRHSFTSGSEVHLSSFIYLILALWMWSILDNLGWKKLYTSLTVVLFSILSMIVLKPNYKWKPKYNLLTSLYDKYQESGFAIYHPNWTAELAKFKQDEVIPFKNYLDQHLTEEQTFYDFSNRPLLYYFTSRSLPSYFNQTLQNIATTRQMEMAIEDLEQYDIPLVLYSYRPLAWLDKTDNIPNALRYHRIHQYLLEHYSPLGQLNNKELWLRNDLNKETFQPGLDPIQHDCDEVHLGQLTHFISPLDAYEELIDVTSDTVTLPERSDKEWYLYMKGEALNQELTLMARQGICMKQIYIDNRGKDLLVPLNWIYPYPDKIILPMDTHHQTQLLAQ